MSGNYFQEFDTKVTEHLFRNIWSLTARRPVCVHAVAKQGFCGFFYIP